MAERVVLQRRRDEIERVVRDEQVDGTPPSRAGMGYHPESMPLREFYALLSGDLVDDVSLKDPTGIEYSAFVLVMARLSGCVTCTSDSFRAMKGCTQCARQTVRRFRGSDLELTALFQQAQEEITNNIKNRHKANDKE